MPIRLTNTTTLTTKTSKNNSKKNMPTKKVITFDVNYINKFRHQNNCSLPEEVMKILNMSTKIKKTMNVKQAEQFVKELDTFDEPALKKKIHSLLNKLAKTNLDTIFQKVSEILKSRKVLIEYAIKMLITNVVSMPFLVDTYAEFYKKLYTPETEEIFQNTFKELLSVLEGTQAVDAKDYDKFCKYMKEKKSFIGLFLFMGSLYEHKIIKNKQIKSNLKYLETTILKSTPEENEKYFDAYSKFLTKLNKKSFINLKKLAEIKESGKLSMRLKFQCMDLVDLQKKL